MMPSVLDPLQNGKTYLKSVVTLGEPDWGSLNDPLEMEFRAKVRRRFNNTVMYQENHGILIPNAGQVHVHDALPLVNYVPNPDLYLTAEARENDSWQTQDDYGDVFLGKDAWSGSETLTNNWINQAWYHPNAGGGTSLCATLGQSAGYGYVCGVPFYWRTVNYSYQWNTWTAPPQVAQVSGPVIISPGLTYQWSATNLQSVTGTLYYEWFLDGTLVSTSPTYSGAINEASSVHNLRVDVTDGYGNWEYANISLSVNTGSCEPNDPNCNESLRLAVPSTTTKPQVRRPARDK